jgi:hypothetical protein
MRGWTQVTLLAIALYAPTAAAQRPAPADPRSLGLANAASLLRDPSAVFRNPAACSRSGVSAAVAITRTTFEAGKEGDVKARQISGPRLGGSIAGCYRYENVAFCLGYHHRVDAEIALAESTQPDSPFASRYLGSSLSRIADAGAFAVSAHWRHLAIGMSLDLEHARWRLSRDLFVGSDSDDPAVGGRELAISADLSGLALRARFAATFAPTRALALAIVLVTPTATWLRGDLTTVAPSQPPTGHRGVEATSGQAELSGYFPAELTLAGAISPASWLVLTGQLALNGLGKNDLGLHLSGVRVLLSQPDRTVDMRRLPLAQHRWGISAAVAFQVTLLPDRLRLLGGYGYEKSSLRGAPSLMSARQSHRLGLGLSASFDSTAIDLGLGYTIPTAYRVDGVPPINPLDAGFEQVGFVGEIRRGELRALMGLRLRF